MKICIYGAGAIGGVIAARLALSGAPVSVVARGAHLAAIRQEGLRLTMGDAERVAQVEASDDPAALGPQDVVIVAVKAHQLSAVVEGLERLMKPQTAVVYAVNGIPWWYFHPAQGADAGGALAGSILADDCGIGSDPSGRSVASSTFRV